MADIFDYLKRRGVISFKDDPFSEVDNLVLAMLAYADFEGIMDDSFKTISLGDADKKYFEKHSRAEAKKSISHFVRAPLLMDGMMKGERFRDTVLTKYVDIIDSDKDMQMSAVTFLLNDGSAYVAFRGTDNTVAGWKEDFNMSYLPETEGQLSAVRYLNEVGAEINRPLRVGGHSKGGNFAVYAAALAGINLAAWKNLKLNNRKADIAVKAGLDIGLAACAKATVEIYSRFFILTYYNQRITMYYTRR